MVVIQSRSAAGYPIALLAIVAGTDTSAHACTGPTCVTMHEDTTTSFVCRLHHLNGLNAKMILKQLSDWIVADVCVLTGILIYLELT